MNEQVSSTTVASGPDIINYNEWSDFYYETTAKIKLLDEPAKTDIRKMFGNAHKAWLDYSAKSLRYKKHQPELYEKYREARKTVEKYITWAGLSGMTK